MTRVFVVLAALAALACASPALAQTAPAVEPAFGAPVVVEVGPIADWLIAAALAAFGGVAGVVAWLLRQVPGNLRWVLSALRLEQLLTVALNDALNRTAGAARGQTVTVDTGLALANQALRYAVEHAPALVKEFGLLNLWKKILARLNVAPEEALPADASPNLADPVFARFVR